jgi:hypothetical protein
MNRNRTVSRLVQYADSAVPPGFEVVSEPVALSEGECGLVACWTQPESRNKPPALTLMKETPTGATRTFTIFSRELPALLAFLGQTDS